MILVIAQGPAWAGGTHRARVFDVSPLESELEEVVFTDLPEDATSLEDSEIRVLNCIDRRTCQDVRTTAGVRNLHHCELEAKAELYRGVLADLADQISARVGRLRVDFEHQLNADGPAFSVAVND